MELLLPGGVSTGEAAALREGRVTGARLARLTLCIGGSREPFRTAAGGLLLVTNEPKSSKRDAVCEPLDPDVLLVALGVSGTLFCGAGLANGWWLTGPILSGSGTWGEEVHLRRSYLVRIKLSIFSWSGMYPSGSLASQYMLHLAFPHFTICSTCSSVQASKSTDLTLEICVPMDLWIPEHRIQTKHPKFHDAHLG